MIRQSVAIFVLALLAVNSAEGSVLPEDRVDIRYHTYSGGDVDIDGPSILVRKKVGKNFSVSANYYVDMISSASIDVITTASPYSEERTQWSMGMDYLRGDTTMRVNYSNSSEPDFDATTYSFSVSQDLFGDLTTLKLSYALGEDVIGNVTDPTFEQENSRHHYGVGLTQVLTPDLITALNFEVITEEGFLNNPYRLVRYADLTLLGYSYEPELYPNTRTSTALGLRAKYHLPYRAAVEAEYRFFEDTWGIESNTASLAYIHPVGPWTFEARYRYHDQTGAVFFADIFARPEETIFRSRDKDLSPLTSNTVGFTASFEFIDGSQGWRFIDRASVSLAVDVLNIEYHEFSDLSTDAFYPLEPLYELDATIFQLHFSFWY